jgi:hypothetical protein
MIELNFPNPVTDDKDFYGRHEEWERIARVFAAGSRKPVIILGERRIGKTSLQCVAAKRLATREAGGFVPLLLPRPEAIRSVDDYAREILQCLCSYLGKRLQETGLVDAGGQFQLTSLGQFPDAVSRLLEAVPPKTFIVCVDEFDAILKKNTDADANRILGLSHYLTGSDLPLVALITMIESPEQMRKAYQSPPIISESEVVELNPFSQDETVEIVTGLLGDQVTLNDEGLDRLFNLSGGHPYFVKLLLDRLLARYWKETGFVVSREMVDEIVPDAAHDSRVQCALNNVYKVHFKQQEQQLVLLLAERQSNGIAAEELKLLGPEYITSVKALQRRGYLVQHQDGGYDFRTEFLGRWIRDWEEYDEEVDRLELATIRQALAAS